MLTRLAIIDADGHVRERDEELLDYLPPPYTGQQALLSHPFFPTVDGWNRVALRVADGAGRVPDHPSARDWLAYLEAVDIQGTVLYPTLGLALGLVRDPRWAGALARGYNDWLHDRYTRVDRRLNGMALLPLQDVSAAVAELRRTVVELGFVGAILPGVGLPQPLGARAYWPVYEAAQELSCLLAVHAGATQGLALDDLERLIAVRTLSHGFAQMRQMTSMVFGGVFDAFPRLRVAYAEAGCGWVPYLAERMDLEYAHRTAQAPDLRCLPSEHLRSGRIFVHCELEEAGIPQAIAALGDSQLFCASDYPHEPKDEFPRAIAAFVARTDLSDASKRCILEETPRRMYGLS